MSTLVTQLPIQFCTDRFETLLWEGRANLSAFRTFVRFVLVWICRFPLPLGSGKGCGLWLWHSLDFYLIFVCLCFFIVWNYACFLYNPCIDYYHFLLCAHCIFWPQMYRQWVPCYCKSSYNFIPVFLKLCIFYFPLPAEVHAVKL